MHCLSIQIYVTILNCAGTGLCTVRIRYRGSQAKYCQKIVPLKRTIIVNARGPYRHGAHNISYNCYAVNTSAIIQQCVCYRTSSIVKVRPSHFSVACDLQCHLATTTYTLGTATYTCQTIAEHVPIVWDKRFVCT